jgi:asparagine synthase (glutamine-hydrolysing)
MCGIAGYIGKDKINSKELNLLKRKMKNRGPDNFGSNIALLENINVYLFHSRLNIVDLTNKANQPFIINNYLVIFNGEIYNFKKLKSELIKKGYSFKTNSDTEVLLTMYIEYKEKCVSFFRGMWAFCIWDMKKKIFFLSRDSFGEKPLFFLKNKKNFYFGSEVKYIKTLLNKKLEVNQELIKKSLLYGYKSIHKNNQTYFKNIYSVNPGESLILDYKLNLKVKKIENFNPRKIKENNKLKDKHIINNIKNLVVKSVKETTVSDVPVAISLSSGIDSSVILGILSKKLKLNIKAFSLIDRGKYNEKYLIEKNVKKNKISCDYVDIDYSEFISKLKSIIDYQDQPISTITYFAQNQLMKEVSKKKYKVILSGSGADEMFAGYYDHFRQLATSLNKKQINEYFLYWKKFYLTKINNKRLKNFFHYKKNPRDKTLIYDYNDKINSYIKFNYKYQITEKKFYKSLLRNRMLNELFFEITPATLRHEDLNCMQYSIENRSPFLDMDILNFMNTVPSSKLIQKGYLKYFLRTAFKDILLKDIYSNRDKIGFNASLKFFLKEENKKKLKDFFLKDKVMKKFVDMKKIYSLVQDVNRNSTLDKFLFNVMNIKLFLEKYN